MTDPSPGELVTARPGGAELWSAPGPSVDRIGQIESGEPLLVITVVPPTGYLASCEALVLVSRLQTLGWVLGNKLLRVKPR